MLERLRVRLAVRHGWRSDARQLEAVRGFQATEADGVWHLHRSLERTEDPRFRALVFTHSLEEESHADAFAEVYNRLSQHKLAPIAYERKALYDSSAPSWKPFAYVHVGEVDATTRFKLIQDELGDGHLRTALSQIVRDEEGHIDLTYDVLRKMGASEPELRSELRRVRLKRAWEEWLRIGRRAADTLATVLLSVFYYSIGPLFAPSARRRLKSPVVEFDNNKVKNAAHGDVPVASSTGAYDYKVLGVSYGYHDASACLVVGGQVVCAIAEERLTRQKHDANFPSFAVERCLAAAGLRPADLDEIVYHEDPHTKFTRVLTASVAPYPRSRKEFVNSVKAWIGRKLWALNAIVARLGVPPERLSYLGHHFSHAVQAFMGSGFERSAVLVVDAVGDWASVAMFRAEWVGGKPHLERVQEVAFPHSVGLVYSAVTAYLGFNPNDSECSTMALAAFGTPRFADRFRAIIGEVDSGLFTVDQSYFNFVNFYRGAVTERFIREFGPARDARTPLTFDCLDPSAPQSNEEQRFADVAASLQLVLEERLLELAGHLHEQVPTRNLCLAGGVSLNCVANGRLLREGPFDSIHIPPDPGDGGTAVGVALYANAVRGGLTPSEVRYSAFVGEQYDEAADVDMLAHVDVDHALPYLKRGVVGRRGQTWNTQRFDDDRALCDEVARRLECGEIVGWYQGRCELGPRALGNRSILIRPDDPALAQQLSRHVKERASFRPYAFSSTEEAALQLLDVDPAHLGTLRAMQFAVRVRDGARDRVRGAIHVDGTTRVQVCTPEHNPRFHALLEAYGERTGCAALLNTSFNPSGYPMVTRPAEALSMFARTDMTALALNRTLVWKT